MSAIEDCYRGFREAYIDYATLTAQLEAWRDAWPELVHLTSLGQTPEGREIWLLTLGPDPDRIRPAAWVDGNIHASELAGTAAALSIAEAVIRAHVEGSHDPLDAVIREILVYVCPRISPDGAEAVLTTGRYVRSVPRPPRPGHAGAERPRWVTSDLDGDGLCLVMRVEDPTGEFVASSEVPGMLVPRMPGDVGPAYKLYPEGLIEGFDGHHVPDPSFLSDNHPDLNRNFPWDWRPEHQQAGAGPYPGSEPESQAVIAFATDHPNIFFWTAFHTFGGVFIRPYGDQPDTKMPPEDLAVYRQLGHWAELETGYPMVSGCEEFTYEPESPLHGDVSDYAHRQRGCVAYVVELWDIFAQLGLPRPKRFVDYYTHLDRAQLEDLARWDARHNGGRVLRPWVPVDHPQLGPVEVGGIDPRFGLWNPPADRLSEVCAGQVRMWRRAASLAPRVRVDAEVTSLGVGLHRLTVTVENHGYLSTQITAEAGRLELTQPLRVQIESTGCEIEGISPVDVAQLGGWGTGRFSGTGALYFARSRGTHGRRVLTWVVRGAGEVLVTLSGSRVGSQTIAVEIP